MHENPIYERSIYDIMIHHKDLCSLTENTSKIFSIYEYHLNLHKPTRNCHLMRKRYMNLNMLKCLL